MEKNEPARSSRGAASLSLSHLDEISCFESLRAYGGRIFRAGEHVDRLWESCAALGRPLPFPKERMLRWIEAALAESGFRDALLRVSVHWDANGQGQAVAIIRHFTAYAEEIYKKGVEIRTAAGRRWTLRAQDPQIKSSQYVPGVLASLDLRGPAPRELLFLNPDQWVAEGAVSNLFIVSPEKTVLTPPASSGILRGVTREVVIAIAAETGTAVIENAFTRHDIYSASECFITNTSSEVLPVVLCDGRRIGAGVPGPVTRDILERFRECVQKDRKRR